MLARWCNEGLEICVQNEWNGEHVMDFFEFQNVFSFFGISHGLSGMLTACGKVIVETALLCERMKAIRTDESLTIVIRPVCNKSRKIFYEDVMTFVSLRQQQQIHVVWTLVAELRSVYGNEVLFVSDQHVDGNGNIL